MNNTAAANGGTADINPSQDLGFLYNRNRADPGGHVWEALSMDPAAFPPGVRQAEKRPLGGPARSARP
jgi:uncharacterized protein